MSEPINCPFCGEYGCDINQSSIPNIEGGWKRAVYCNVCFCEGPPAKTDAEAIERWNTRASGLMGLHAARDAVVRAAQKWGETDADDAVAGLAAELELSEALTALSARGVRVPSPEQRARFEQWAARTLGIGNFDKDDDGVAYLNGDTDDLWCCWQEAVAGVAIPLEGEPK